MRPKWRVKFLLALAMTLAGPALLAQSSQLTGRVSDPSAAVIPAAPVRITNEDTGVELASQTNPDGYYTFGSLIPGNYRIMVSAPGFKTFVRSGIKLDVAQIGRVDVELQVGQTSDEVTVISIGPLLQSESPSVGQVVARQIVVDLPLNGRQFTQLAYLTPGAVSGGTGGFGGPVVRINGGRSSATIYMIDGVNTAEQFSSGTTIVPPPDAVQEFKVQTNVMSAEYSQEPAAISVALRSGTNRFHGGLFEFLRNNQFDARNFFAQTKSELRYNQFGGTLGGPVIRNRTFFFLDYQGTRVLRGNTHNTITATNAERNGDFSADKTIVDPLNGQPFPGNRIPGDRMASAATFFLKFFPPPNAGLRNYIFAPSDPTNTNQFDVKIDHRFSERDSLAYSQTYQQNTVYTSGAVPQNGGLTVDTLDERFGVSETHLFGPSALNEFRLGYVRDAYASIQQGLGTDYAAQAGIGGLQQTSLAYPGFPGISISGFTSLDVNSFRPLTRRENKYEITDLLTKTKGAHTIKAGVDIRWMGNGLTNGAYGRGNFVFNSTYTGSSFADFLLGWPYQGQRSFPRNLFGEFFREQQFFVQDDWKVTSRLTLNLGLRYDLNHAPTSLNHMFVSVDPVADKIVVASDANGKINTGSQQVTSIVLPLFASRIIPSSSVGLGPALRQPDRNNFAPRIGLAWRAIGGLVVRAGYGLFYTLEEGNQAGSTGQTNPPFIVDELVSFNTTPLPTRTLATYFQPITTQGYGIGPVIFFQLNPNRPNSYTQQWNVALQKNIRDVVTVEGAYVGSESLKLPMSYPLNVPLPGPGVIQARRQNPFFASGSLILNDGTASYNALQAKAEIRSWHGLNLLGAYTLAKGLDGQSADYQGSPVQDPHNLRGERGRTDIDRHQIFTASAVYRLSPLRSQPKLLRSLFGDWGIASIFTAQTGQAFNPTISTDPANTGTSRRPNRIGGGTLTNPNVNGWFDLSAFSVPLQYTYGNAGRNILSGPSLLNSDLGLLKDFRLPLLGENGALEFRAELFDFTNTPHFALPVANIQSPGAGRIQSASDGRDIQFALKLMF